MSSVFRKKYILTWSTVRTSIKSFQIICPYKKSSRGWLLYINTRYVIEACQARKVLRTHLFNKEAKLPYENQVAFSSVRDFTPQIRQKIESAGFNFLDIFLETDLSDCCFDIKKEPSSAWKNDEVYMKRLKKLVKSRHFNFSDVELNYEDFYVCK